MNITRVTLRKVSGTMATSGTFWEERLAMPLDVYEEFRERKPVAWGNQVDDQHYKLSAIFVEIETDDGAIGIGGPMDDSVASIVARSLRPLLMGRDAFAHEYLWDIMHRSLVHGRQGEAMMAVSAVDCALWDLKGRALNQPVYRLLGGPTRPEVPAYASMLGNDVLDPGLVRERAKQHQEMGYTAQVCARTLSWCAHCGTRLDPTATSCWTAGRAWI
jgi:L-alanine-DL-glutamate epimerase-like enolase superfamily enzyme